MVYGPGITIPAVLGNFDYRKIFFLWFNVDVLEVVGDSVGVVIKRLRLEVIIVAIFLFLQKGNEVRNGGC